MPAPRLPVTGDDRPDITERMLRIAARQPGAPFLQAPGRVPMAWGTLAQRIGDLRARFASWGIERGDVVAGPAVDRLEYAAALSIVPASATFAPLNPKLASDACAELLVRLAPRAVLLPADRDHPMRAIARRMGIAEIAMTPDRAGEAGAFDLSMARSAASLETSRRVSPDWPFIDATSGTTGRSKLVPHLHRQLVAQADAYGAWFGMTPDDVSAHTSAVHFALGKRTAYMLCVLNGGSVLCLPESDAGALIGAIAEDRVTYVPATFAVHRELLLRSASSPPRTGARLRFLCVASGALEPAEVEALEAAFRVPVVSAYGATEIGNALAQHLDRARRMPGLVGVPVGAEVRIVDEAGREVARGDVGEIRVRGPQVIDRYHDDPGLDAKAFVDGWYRTGDLARRVESGEIAIVGRVHDLINRGGEKFSPAQIDAVLRSIPGVVDAAAFGVPHPRLGEEIVAAIVREPTATLTQEAVRTHVRNRLAARYAPRHVWFVDALPRTETGKVRRSALPDAVGFDPAMFAGPAAEGSAAPDSPLEAALGGLWASVLGVASVDRDADFFMLGGDSLRGASLVEQVRAVFGADVPVQGLFEDAGTVAAMARRIERERASRRAPGAPAPIPRRDPARPVPLSHAQARAWFLHRLDPASDAYHESRLWHVDGDLDVDALSRALAAVAARQAILRTRYVPADGEPRQVVDATAGPMLEVVDLSGAGPDAGARLDEAVHERMSRPFDLAAAPPVRFTLFVLGGRRHALLRVWHHITSDGLSAPILQDDLTEAYAAAREGRPPGWTPLPIDFADFAAWQREELAGPAFDRALDACSARLADLPTLALPTDRRRPAAQSFNGGVVTRTLDAGAAAALKAIGRRRGATPFMTFFAVFATLLSRLSGDEDFAIGTPVAGRSRPELAKLIGFFANTLAIRVDLAGSPAFGELVDRTRERMLEAFESQDVPLERLVDALGVPRDPSRNPLFQVAFAMREADGGDLALAGAVVRRDASRHGRAKFDLTLSLVDGPRGIAAHWEYCADLFGTATIERMARQFESLVAAAAADPDRSVASLPLMDAAQRARIVAGGVCEVPGWPSRESVHRRFAAQAAMRGGAIAIGPLGYDELDERANRLAQALVADGIGRGAFVGVSRARAADVAIAWLAVLKAGAAYVPIDPDLPDERVAFMLADARITHVIADDVVADRLARPGLTVLRPDGDAARLAALPPHAPDDHATADDPAYAIYTSGSTGLPKGVVVPHRAVLRLVCGSDYVRLAPGDVVAQMANPAFDASTFEFWGPLLNGARIAPVAKTTALAPRALASALALERVTTLFITTALFNAVARESPGAFRGVREVLFGGEAVEPRWAREVLRAGPPGRLLHVYGPTESTTFATWHDVREVASDAATIPIGRPIANTEAFVLRADGEPAAPGEPGELWLGGPGLAIGYLGSPALTAERFVERTIAPLPARRLYRTGDRVRLRVDGAIEYLGRADRQVKVRGHRIELEEVESALVRLPQVREAVVVLRGETSETRQVVAYLVPANPAAPPPPNLVRELRRVLPEYMLPGAIVWLPALPLNASGKVDRRALPAPASAARPDKGVQVGPRDMFEGIVLRIWEDVLGTTGLGVYDRFFEIGGHSLLAARLVDEIERQTGCAVPLTAMFADDTVEGLAKALRDGVPKTDAPVFALNASGSRPPFVYLHGDFVGGGFYSRTLATGLGSDQPTLIVHPHGLVEDHVPDSIEAMAADRLRALREIRPHGPYVLGGHCYGGVVAYEMARQLAAQGESIPAVVLIDAKLPEGYGDADAGRASFLTLNAPAGPTMLRPRDRVSDAELRYRRAMDRYEARPYDGLVVVIRPYEQGRVADARPDLGWGHVARNVEVHDIAGNHTTLLTRHMADLLVVLRDALSRAPRVPA